MGVALSESVNTRQKHVLGGGWVGWGDSLYLWALSALIVSATG